MGLGQIGFYKKIPKIYYKQEFFYKLERSFLDTDKKERIAPNGYLLWHRIKEITA